MSKAPAFQLYAADFYTDTVSWTAAEVGVYFRLLMHEWINGPLPSSMSKLARIAGVDARNMQKMWSAELANKFLMDDAEMYINVRLEQTRQKQTQRIEVQREKGKSGAEKRWKKDIAPAIAQAQPEDSSSSSFKSIINNTLADKPVIGHSKVIPYQQIIDLFHQHLPMCPRIKDLTDERKKIFKARWNQKELYQDAEWWNEFFSYIRARCPFLVGEGDKYFLISWDWLMTKSNFQKTQEGNYEKR
jgi:uncharacterized protein YdaU (DUF1376 family)